LKRFTHCFPVCTLMEAGIIMMFGSRAFESSSIIEAYSQTFHVPYISHSFGDHVAKDPWSFQIHMRPSHTQALVDVIEHFKWRNFYYVYDSDEGNAFNDQLILYFVRKITLYFIFLKHDKLVSFSTEIYKAKMIEKPNCYSIIMWRVIGNIIMLWFR